jgi:HK97 family phage major capsid protein
MATLKEQRDSALTDAKAIAAGAKAAQRDMTSEEVDKVKALIEQADQIKASIEHGESVKAIQDRLGELNEADEKGEDKSPSVKDARDVGEFFAKSGMFEELQKKRANGDRFSVSTATEYKAATDPTLTTGITVPPTFGGVVQTRYRRLTVADLLAQGTISGNAITYWTQGTLTGDVATVVEGAVKPSLNFAFGQVTETLTKLAGVTKVSDEMNEDLDFLVSVIRSQLIQRLQLVEEDQLLNGNGTAPNLRGILNRVGIQTYATAATFTAKKGMDAIFHAITMSRINAFAEPDGVVINPLDYEALRLGADGQAQYYGGGPFTGAYGNDGLRLDPGLWTLPTVVTPAIAQGTVLVGDFKTSAQVFRKGGIRIDSTNSNEDDFKRNLVAWRAEERIALAVYYPSAFVKVTLTP